MTRPSRVMVLRSILFATAVALTGACGGRHTVHGDEEPDSEADADADWDQEETPLPDGDESVDGEADVIADADDAVDADRDWDPADGTWLHCWPRGAADAITGVQAGGGGSVFVSGASGGLPWVARLDRSGAEVWSSRLDELPGGAYYPSLSGTDTLAALVARVDGAWLVGIDPETGMLLSQVSVALAGEAESWRLVVESLTDGSSILAFGLRERGVEVARYSFAEGVAWSRLLVDDDYLAYFLATSAGSGGVVFVSWWVGVSAWQGSVVAALGSDGELLWARRAISDECGGLVWGLAATGDGGVVLAGHGSGAGCGVWLVKLDASGGEEWALFVGDNVEGVFDLSDGEAAFGVAVGSTGEVLAVGLTTDGAPPHRQDALALWVEPTGEVRRMARIQDLEGARESTANVAAAVPGGGWLIGGAYYSGTPFLASVDAEGRLDHDCENIHDLSLPVQSVALGGAFLDLAVEEGSLVVGESDLMVEETSTAAERLCD